MGQETIQAMRRFQALGRYLRRFWPLLLLAALAGAVFASGGHQHLSFATLQQHEASVRAMVAARPIASGLAFMALYIVVAALALPGALWLTVASGLVFGTFWGGTLTLIGATLGAMVLFVAARTALAEPLRARAGGRMRKLQEGFVANAVSWMLIVRLIPLFPFFLVNLAAGLAGLRLWLFGWTSFLGMAPAVYIYASLGNGLSQVVRLDRPPNLSLFVRPDVLLPLLGLAILASLPMLWRLWQQRAATAKPKA